MVDKSGACNDKQPIEHVWNVIKTAEEDAVECDELTLTEMAHAAIKMRKLHSFCEKQRTVYVFFPWGCAQGKLHETAEGFQLTVEKAEVRPFSADLVAWVEDADITLGV